jgi:hypothetical protein
MVRAMSSDVRRIDSGIVVGLGILGAAIVLLSMGSSVGWSPAWRAFGVTPLSPPFFDMHVINDYAACAAKGVDAYAPHACNVANFNIPAIWLLLGSLGLDGSDSTWLSLAMIAASAIVMIILFKGRHWTHGVVGLGAILSPSVMMGVERGNLDLLILALVGSAAVLYEGRAAWRTYGALVALYLGVLLKLFPVLCVSLAARLDRKTLLFACALATLSLIYVGLSLNNVFLIRRNVPTTFMLSYGYKTVFLGVDHVRSEAGLAPLGLADTWIPALTAAVVILCAVSVSIDSIVKRREFCSIDASVAGTAFLFGAGVYCGTYVLGTNFIYRLMFLLLCLPQLLDWQLRPHQDSNSTRIAEVALLILVLGVLWSNGNANGHEVFLFLPQLLDWLLFFYLTLVVTLSLLRTWAGSMFRNFSIRSR